MAKIKAVLFDMDGVLIEAKEWHFEAMNRALSLFGMAISRYDHLVTYDGLPTRMKLKMLSVERGLPEELHEFINEMKQIYTLEMVHTLCKPSFHHEYALSRLRERGYSIAVCSNSITNTIKVMMEKASLEKYLDFFVSAQDVLNPKPAPDMYVEAMNRLEVRPDECIIVEDNENGIKAAKASGAWVMEVDDVDDVNYQNIMNHIRKFEEE
ncbi:HAD family phosphatase [Thalassolituus sp.]|jgi:HAD superfamily hydrolase (TIGR01509 family)|uniref:HAD family hydrolase n=1 Tax=Thalassolituus sp. TaxID=2030822 RepID=UPI002A8073EE|nr:HAD family phosphatase [Thalassolituus sp.]